MEIKIYLNKSLEENAALCFDKAKKLKRKTQGAREALEEQQKKLEKLKKEESKRIAKEEKIKKTEKKWFHKFRWFISSEGFLVIGGRDATTNEIVMKKHTRPEDLVFHTEMAGSPFVVIQAQSKPDQKQGEKPGEETMKEAAIFCASYSRAWQQGTTETDVYYITPEQVSKEAEHGEYLNKGAFMIRGKKNYIRAKLDIALGLSDNNGVMAGPLSAVKMHCKEYVIVKQGNKKLSDVAKKIQKTVHAELDEIVRALPQGVSV